MEEKKMNSSKTNSDNMTSKKRKRNTTDEQYAIYLNEMEIDYALRSGTINPTMEDNYLEHKWQKLSEKLNSAGNGPQLEVDEWKKRFKDWKNTTRAKYRKLQEKRLKTGGGPQSDIKMSALEERGLGVWGKVTVTGCSVTETGGLPQENSSTTILQVTDILQQNEDCNVSLINNCSSVFDTNVPEILPIDDHLEDYACNSSPSPSFLDNIRKLSVKKRSIVQRPKPLNEIASNLLKTCEVSNTNIVDVINKVGQIYENIEQKKLDLSKQ